MKNYRLILASCFIVFNCVSAFSQSTQEDPSKAQPQPHTLSVNRILTPNKTSDESDDLVDADLSLGGRTRNRAFYFANRITPGGNFLIGVDYLRWRTEYKGSCVGLNNCLNTFSQYNF